MLELLVANWLVIGLFFTIAILYSSVGFGGGSSYLAILTLTGIAFSQVRFISLSCNIVVVSMNVFQFQKRRMYRWKEVLPLISLSIPLAFLGGFVRIGEKFFFVLLACILSIAAITMWFSKKTVPHRRTESSGGFSRNSAYAGIIGFISGMVGIGGGIFLAPWLHLKQWDVPKRISAVASLFILLNSISGMLGQLLNPSFLPNWELALPLLMVVLIGSYLGNRINQAYLSPVQLKKGTALLILYVSFRILKNIFYDS